MNQSPKFNTILYSDSPFLPPVTLESLQTIRKDFYTNFMPLSVAVAKEVALEAIKQNQTLEQNFDWISEAFKVSPQNLYDFFIGFITPPTLIVGGYNLKTRSIKDVIKLYCPPTDDPNIIDHNRYKMRHLFDAFRIIESSQHHHPVTITRPIFDLCKTDLFKSDWYYLAGIHGSEILFNRLSSHAILQ